MDNRAVRLLGLCKRAGKLITGERAVGDDTRGRRKIRLIIIADGAAENTVSRAKSHARAGRIPLLSLPCDCETLGHIIGRDACAMVGITDSGLAQEIEKQLKSV
jgi:ribosomal protein L7Ae-like RNA K-turn-binding protein